MKYNYIGEDEINYRRNYVEKGRKMKVEWTPQLKFLSKNIYCITT